jgi:hypothetical protein
MNGSISSGITNLIKLKYINLKNNYLTGDLPDTSAWLNVANL